MKVSIGNINLPPLLHQIKVICVIIPVLLDCQDCGTVPRSEDPETEPSESSSRRFTPTEEGTRFLTTHDFLSVPRKDSIITMSQLFLDAMCPIEKTEEAHSAFTYLPVVMPCQVACPPALGNRSRKPAQIMWVYTTLVLAKVTQLFSPHLIQLHNHISGAMRMLQNVGPSPKTSETDEYKTFLKAAGVPFLQAFQIGVRRACTAGNVIYVA